MSGLDSNFSNELRADMSDQVLRGVRNILYVECLIHEHIESEKGPISISQQNTVPVLSYHSLYTTDIMFKKEWDGVTCALIACTLPSLQLVFVTANITSVYHFFEIF